MNQGDKNQGVVNVNFGAGVSGAGDFGAGPPRDWCEDRMVAMIRDQRERIDQCFKSLATETVDTYRAHLVQVICDSMERLRFLLWMCTRCGFVEARAVCESALTLSSDWQRLIDAKK